MQRSWYSDENKSESQMKLFTFQDKQLGLYSYLYSDMKIISSWLNNSSYPLQTAHFPSEELQELPPNP